MNKENGFKLSQERPQPATSLPRLVVAFKDKFLLSLNGLLAKMLDGADDALFELADKAQSPVQQTQYFDAMRELRIKRRGVEARFIQQLQQRFDSLGRDERSLAAGESGKILSIDSLTLVQHDQLEENLAIDAMVLKARAKYQGELNALVARFEVLLAKGIELDKAPFEPAALCQAFHQASELIALDIQSKLIIYKLFERFVLSGLSQSYQQLNQFLSQSGVLAEADSFAAPARQPASRRQSETAAYGAEGAGAEAAFQGYPLPTVQPLTQPITPTLDPSASFGVLQALLAEQREFALQGSQLPIREHLAAAAASLSTPMPYLPTQNLLATLSQLQHRPLNNLQQSGQVRQLVQHYSEHAGQKVERNDQDAIDIVSMLFEFILGDANLPDEFKLQLSRLQIPYIKLALLDKNFFANKQHPARRLLNLLAQTAIGWNKEDREGSSELALKIETLVQRVLNEFQDNPSLFEQLLAELELFINHQQQKTRLLEQRLREAEEGKAKAQFARTRVELEIAQKLANTPIPTSLMELIRQEWGQVLFLTFLREGDQSQTWRIRGAVLDRLRQLPQRSGTDLADSLHLIKTQLQEGLDSISCESFKIHRLLEQLDAFGVQLTTMLTSPVVAAVAPPPVAAIASVVTPVLPEPVSSIAPVVTPVLPEPVSTMAPVIHAVLPEPVSSIAPVVMPVLPEPVQERAGEHSVSNAERQVPRSSQAVVTQASAASSIETEATADGWQQIAERLKRSTVLAARTEQQSVAVPEAPAAPVIEDRYWQQVQDLGTGTWLELDLNGVLTRCKLAAKIALADKYICVNRAGVKVAELSRAQFAEVLRTERARILDDSAVFERALQSVISTLQQHKEPQW